MYLFPADTFTVAGFIVVGDVHFFGREDGEWRDVQICFELFGEEVDGGFFTGVNFDHGDFVFEFASEVDVLRGVFFAVKDAVLGVAVAFGVEDFTDVLAGGFVEGNEGVFFW